MNDVGPVVNWRNFVPKNATVESAGPELLGGFFRTAQEPTKTSNGVRVHGGFCDQAFHRPTGLDSSDDVDQRLMSVSMKSSKSMEV